MPKMAIAWLVVFTALALRSFINPLFGTLGYIFEYYLRPKLHWWGQPLPDLRWNLTISAILTLTYFMKRQSLPEIGPARRGPATCLVGLLLIMVLVTPSIAASPSRSWDSTVKYSKFILFHGLLVGTVRTELAFDAVVAVHVAGATWWGWESYRNPKRTAGRLANVGSGDTRGDNGTAAHLMTVLPFIAVYLFVHRDRRFRALSLLAAPLVVNTIVLCNSRGATMAMIGATGCGLLLARRGHRLRMAAAGILLAGGVYALADPQFIARQQRTDYREDSSAMGRVEAWKGAGRLIADHPLGTGGQGFYELSPIYATELVDRMGGESRDPHNTLVLVASEWGILGLTLYLGYYICCYLLLRDVRRKSDGGIWYYRSVAVQVAMVGIFIAGLFTDRLYSEAPYWMGALAVALHRLHSHKLQQEAQGAPAVAPSPADVGYGYQRAV